jgi:DNA invertase Pin-like site-specific DNA recombinase
MTNSTFKVAAYIRCSTQEQADAMSLDTQRARIAAWAEAVGAEVVEWIEDAGVSGSKPLADRAGGSKVAAYFDARRPTVDSVVVLRLDRLGRDAAETLAIIRRVRTGKVGLISVSDRLDLGTPTGRAMAGMAAVFSELERGLIAQRTRESLNELKMQGRAYGPTPFGMTNEGGRLIPNVRQQKVIARAQALRAEGMAYNKIATALDAEGHKPQRAARWSAMAVRSVLATTEKLSA